MFLSRFVRPVWGLALMATILLLLASNVPIDGQAGEGISRFIGRFHILVLHFPVTLLLLAPAVSLFGTLSNTYHVKPAVKILWWLGSVTVFITVSMGMLLAANEGFEITEVRQHMLGGLSVALLTFVATAIVSHHSESKPLRYAYTAVSASLVICLFVAAHAGGNLVHGDQYLVRFAPAPVNAWLSPKQPAQIAVVDDAVYNEKVRPLLDQYCFGCHGADTQKGGVQLDILSPDFVKGDDAPHWHAALDMINTGEMPPAKKKQPSDEERRVMVEWLTDGILLAKEAKKGKSEKVIRRLSKHQYQNTMMDLMGIDTDFAGALPDDPLSEIGFSNSAELMQNSTLHLETFEEIARTALSKAIDPEEKPETVHYRVHFGENIGKGQPHSESGGYLGVPVDKSDFYVEVLDEQGQPKPDSELGDLKKYFSASLRGSEPHSFKMAKDGIALFSAKPHKETTDGGKFGSWHGPSPNVAMQVKRYFPTEGDFVIRIKASKDKGFKVLKPASISAANQHPTAKLSGSGELLVQKKTSVVLQANASKGTKNVALTGSQNNLLTLANHQQKGEVNYRAKMKHTKPSYYEVDLVHPEVEQGQSVEVAIHFGKQTVLKHLLKATGQAAPGDMVVSTLGFAILSGKLQKIKMELGANFPGFSQLVLVEKQPSLQALERIGAQYAVNQVSTDKQPVVVPYIGARTDDGMDYKALSHVHTLVTPSGESELYTFKGRLENYPVPNTDAEGDQWISGSLKVGVWNGDMISQKAEPGSVMKVDYIEFQAPYFEQWPTAQHKRIFIDSTFDKTSPEYAKQVITHFAQRAYRRPVSEEEIQPFFTFWQTVAPEFERFEDGVKEALVAVLTSTNFLYLAEPNEALALASDEAVEETKTNQLLELFGLSSVVASEQSHAVVSDYALANRLSYFLWNSPPDATLLTLASKGELKDDIDHQIQRMLQDSDKLQRFVRVFASEWLRVDRLLGQTVDVEAFPDFNRFIKQDMAQETTEFITLLIQQNLSALNLIESDFAMLNQNLADFYGVPGVAGPEFRQVSLNRTTGRGGVLGQGAFLTGHADGVHSHPVKRAVWLKSKIMGVEPPPPPPNVPDLNPDTPGFEKLTLKQQLEVHRDKESCRDCHAKIDPFGIVFENYDAVGRYRADYKGTAVDALSILPDGTEVNGMTDIKQYLLKDKPDQVVMSLLKHMFAYALGKEVSFHDESELNALLEQVKQQDYQMQAVISAIVHSPSFNQG